MIHRTLLNKIKIIFNQAKIAFFPFIQLDDHVCSCIANFSLLKCTQLYNYDLWSAFPYRVDPSESNIKKKFTLWRLIDIVKVLIHSD